MNVSTALNLRTFPIRALAAARGRGLRGLGQDDTYASYLTPSTTEGIFSAIQTGLNVLGSAVAKQPSPYVAANDPRYRAMPAPQITQYPISTTVMNAGAMQPPTAKMTGGLNIDSKTLVIIGLVGLAFLLGRK